MTHHRAPLFEAVFADGQCPGDVPVDILAHVDGRSFAMLGPGGAEREKSVVSSLSPEQCRDALPVLLGAGL